jgi:uncharacterized damage-inducible protein DinB
MTLSRSLLILAAAASPAIAQTSGPSPVADARSLWSQTRAYITQAAKDVPESLYSFKPTPEVRSFGELIAHVAGSQSMFCAIALGEKPPAEDAVEKGTTTKAALLAALEASNKDCARAYAQSDKAVSETVDIFGTKRTRFYALLNNATHDDEHYGNIVTYMRMNKMVPPSSKPSTGGK